LCAFVTVLVFLGVLSGQSAARMEQPAAAAVTTPTVATQTKEPA
jgi:hypothetical protein